MADTKIQWCDSVWNPVRGCSRVSAGCDNCYAMGQAHRFSGPGQPYEGLTTIRRSKVDWSGSARLVPEMLDKPLHWRKPRRIFVNSMSDLFHGSLSFEEIAAVFGVMAACPQHTFQTLTKRPKRALEFFAWLSQNPIDQIACLADDVLEASGVARLTRAMVFAPGRGAVNWPLPNVHLGVSVEDQKTADERIPLLLQCPAAVRWVSAEPLLGPVRFEHDDGGCVFFPLEHGAWLRHSDCEDEPVSVPGIDWVVVGGESGAGARPCNIEWIRSIVRQCKAAGVPVFVKQMGANYCDALNGIGGALTKQPDNIPPIKRLQCKKGADPSEWPEDLMVREFPGGAA